MSTSMSRNAYTALTPECADFATHHNSVGVQQVPLTPHGSTSSLSVDDYESAEDPEGRGISAFTRIHALRERAREVLDGNTGLLLVAAAQAFLSFMTAAVKKLNGIEPPIPTLEVCAFSMLRLVFEFSKPFDVSDRILSDAQLTPLYNRL
jgi:hypothetical protein